MGGIEPAREYLLAAMQAGKHVVSANKQLLSQHGEELFGGRARARRAAALRGCHRRRRAGGARARGIAVGDADRAHPRHRQRHDQLHPHRDGRTAATYAEALAEAQRRGFAEADPSDDVSGRDAAAKMAILARLAFGTPVHLDEVRYEGIEHLRRSTTCEYARELGLGLKLVGTAERRGGGLSVHVHPTLPLRRAPAGVGVRALQRGHGRVRDDHRDHPLRPGRRRPPDGERGARRRRQRR